MTMQFDRESKRWTLDGRGLHCGDGIDVWLCERWVPVCVEWQQPHGWVLFAHDDRVRLLPGTGVRARWAR